MRHKKLNKRFQRNRSQRKALMQSLVRALFISHRIETTTAKAKEARKLAEKLITLAKKKSLSSIRAINDVLQDRSLTRKLVTVLAPLFNDRTSGFTRVIRIGFRKGDGTSMAILELVNAPVVEKKHKPKKEKKVNAEEAAVREEKHEKKAVEDKLKEPKREEPKKAEPKKEDKAKHEEKKGLFGGFKKFFKKDDKEHRA